MSMFRWMALLVFLAGFGALSSGALSTPAFADDEPAASASTQLMARAGQVAQDVAKLRGLKIKSPIERGVMTKTEVKTRILEILHREYTPAELDAESLGMKRLGLISAKTDYVKMMVDMLQDQIAGFYDQFEKKLYIAGWAQSGGDMLMAHEIDHALQDQHFDLVKFMGKDRSNGDAMAARQALVEGDGMALMLEFQMAAMKQAPPWGNPMIMAMVKRGMDQGMGGMMNVPLALREGLIFPYTGGVEFIAHFRKHKSWKAIDAMYLKPPLSTEHILHPSKYDSYEQPIAVAASAKVPAALAAHSEKVSNVIGEKGVELFLRTHGVKLERAVTAAAGWGGDRFVVYAASGHKGSNVTGTVGVWLTAWDESRDAHEFFLALEHALPGLSGGKRVGSGALLRFESKNGLFVAERKDDRVLLLIGAPTKGADTLRTDIWTTWRVGP